MFPLKNFARKGLNINCYQEASQVVIQPINFKTIAYSLYGELL